MSDEEIMQVGLPFRGPDVSKLQPIEQGKAKSAGSKGGYKPRRSTGRVKTGCRTCRNRRVKCDEAKPICMQCTKSGKYCERWDAGFTHQSLINAAPLQRRMGGPDEEIIEAFRYYVTTMIPHHLQVQHAENAWDEYWSPQKKICDLRSKFSFIMIVMSHRIGAATNQLDDEPGPHAVGFLTPTWNKYFEYMSKAIQELNRHISSGASIRMVLHAIVDLLSVEVGKQHSFWRAHIEGFGGLIRIYGGVKAVIESKTAPTLLALQFVLIFWVIGNSTSPSNDQMAGLYDWTDDEVHHVYSQALFFAVECPSTLFISILRINRLRETVSLNHGSHDDYVKIAGYIFETIYNFDPDDWTESFPIPDEPRYVHLAHMFKASVALYGLLSLPDSVIDALRTSRSVDPKRICRELLRDHIRAYFMTSDTLSTLPWPLAVLGVAVAEGAASDRQSVEILLDHLCKSEHVGPHGSSVLRRRLRNFWASGKKGWDDCFDTPCILLDT